MTYDISGRALTPLSELIELGDFPLAEFLPLDSIASVFDGLYYTDALAFMDGDNLVVEASMLFEADLSLGIPGTDAIALVFASAGVGWSRFQIKIVLGPDISMTFREVTIGLRISEDILKDKATNGPAEIFISSDIIFSQDGIQFDNYQGATLDPAYVSGTEVLVEATDVRPVFGPIDPPDWLLENPNFAGLSIEKLSVTIPDEYLQTDSGADLKLELTNAAIGTTGFTGIMTIGSADLQNPITGLLLGFPFRFREFRLEIEQNALIEVALGVDLRLEAFEDGQGEKWVAVDVEFGGDGSITAALASAQAQPAEASSNLGALVEIEFQSVFRAELDALRFEKRADKWALFFSGGMQVLLDGANWPKIEFDEIGVDSTGEILLSDGAGIGFSTPLVVEWHFVELVVNKFRFGYAEGSQTRLQFALSAEVNIIEGLPAGVNVEGLTVEWTPGSNATPAVSFSGIGVEFGVPGTFHAEIAIEYTESATGIEFRGKGSLALTALDMSIDIGIVVGENRQPEQFVYLYLYADAKLMPTGIMIGATGLSIYGFQGLLAYNMALDIDNSLPVDERFYSLFVKPPVGMTDQSKWIKRRGQNALGVGVLVGTADKGFTINVKGMLVVAFPDLTILLQAKANLLKLKPDLSTEQEGSLEALLVYASGQSTLSLDVIMQWGMPDIIEIAGSARAFFSFADSNAWYFQAGIDQDGKRIAAHAFKWGGNWLFTAGSWFQLDPRGVVTGVQIALRVRASEGGFWVEVSGSARAEMALAWEPFQLEGSLALRGRVAAGFEGISIGVTLSGNARARVPRPFEIEFDVSACVQLLFWEACASFSFEWGDPSRTPRLVSPVRGWATTPHHWTPRPLGSSGEDLDYGITSLELNNTANTNLPVVQPHSYLSLDFGKPMVDGTGEFNEAVLLDDDGFITIGRRSGWSAQYRLDAVTLANQSETVDEQVSIFGTWLRTTPAPNTTLRLLTSERFGSDGEYSTQYLDPFDLDYCDTAETSESCVDVDDIEPGYGRLPDGSLYHYIPGDGNSVPDDGLPGDPSEPEVPDDDDGVTLEPGAVLTVIPSAPVEEIVVVQGPRPPEKFPQPHWLCGRRLSCLLLSLVVVLILLILLLLWLGSSRTESAQFFTWMNLALLGALIASVWVLVCNCCLCARPGRGGLLPVRMRSRTDGLTRSHYSFARTAPPIEIRAEAGSTELERRGDAQNSALSVNDNDASGVVSVPVQVVGNQAIIQPGNETIVIKSICFAPGHGTSNWTEVSQRGGTITSRESWTIPAEARILPPNQKFELSCSYTTRLKHPNGSITDSSTTLSAHFETAGPPIYSDALRNYIAEFYPRNGMRPVYTGYALTVRFVKEYVPFLYTSVGQQLRFRLLDGQGRPVMDDGGDELLLPVTSLGRIERSTSDNYWEEIYQVNVGRGCVSPRVVPSMGQTVIELDSVASAFRLTPNSQYTALLVSDGHTNIPLLSWSFTTSNFETFTELVTRDRVVLAPKLATGEPNGGSFDEQARALGVDTIAYVERFTVTPLVGAVDGGPVAFLLESPEPMASESRLSIRVGETDVSVASNIDETRLLVTPATDIPWGIGTLLVELTWLRDAGDNHAKLRMSGDTTPELVNFDVSIGAGI